jgi:TonB-linked SusC/RagA family outer membrane protein
MRSFIYIMVAVLLSLRASAQDTVQVRGLVREAATGIGLAGINISVPGYSAAITNEKGEFRIKTPGYNTALVITGPGYQAKVINLNGRHHITASLHEETFNSIYDMANMPLGKFPRMAATIPVTTLNITDSWEQISSSPESYLQGKVPGLQVTRRSGTPGMGADLFMRGYTSLYATNRPLVVVDGMIYDTNEYGGSLISGYVNNPLADIDIRDIDNMTVLCDGTSTYGTKGANGVILITTSHAKDVATRIDFGITGGVNTAPARMPVMQAGDYRLYLSDLLQSSGRTAAEIAALPYMNDDPNPDYYRYHNNVDWQREVTNQSLNQQYFLKVAGGDDIATYGLSLGYLKQGGTIRNTDLGRYQTRFNADLNLSKRLKAAINLAFTTNTQKDKDQGTAPKTNPLYLSLIKAPFLARQAVNDEGIASPSLADYDIFNVSNPVAIINRMQAINKNYRFFGSIRFNYQLTKSISINTLTGITFDKVRENFFIPESGVHPDTLANSVVYNRSASNVERYYSLYNDTRITYDQQFNRQHHLTANAGVRYSNNNSESDYGLGFNSATDEFVSVGMGQNQLRKVGGTIGKWNWLNTYVNADYAYREKYFLSFNMAVDGSSRYTYTSGKYAAMPGLAAGWLIISDRNHIDALKLRAGVSRTGNDDIGNYTSRQYYISQSLLGLQGLVRANIANPGLKWETVTSYNAGLDAAFYNERLNVSLDVFQHHTTDMLTIEPVAAATGFDHVVTNNSAMKTRGIEVSLFARVVDGVLKWDMGLNLSTYRNKITKIPGNQLLTTYGNATILTATGRAANLFYGYRTNGVYTTTEEATKAGLSAQAGDIRFVDSNGDHRIDDKDRQVIGDPNPDLTGALTNHVAWRRWSLDAVFTFSHGNDIYNDTRAQLESMSNFNNQTLAVRNRWRQEGQVTDIPRAAWGDPSGNARFSDRWIEKGDYLRLQHLSLCYELTLKQGAVKYVRISATASNVFTLTNYLGFDPEFSHGNSVFTRGIDDGLFPLYRTVQLGIRMGL